MFQHEISLTVVCIVPFIGGCFALIFAEYLKRIVANADSGEGIQVVIAGIIQDGAKAFLRTEYTYLFPFVVFMAIFFFIEEGITCANKSAVYAKHCTVDEFPGRAGWRMSMSFVCGAALSASAGYAGMVVATDCNVKACNAAKEGQASPEKDGLNRALKVAFAGGGVMGFTVVGLALTGLSALFWLFGEGWVNPNDSLQAYTGMITSTNQSLVIPPTTLCPARAGACESSPAARMV